MNMKHFPKRMIFGVMLAASLAVNVFAGWNYFSTEEASEIVSIVREDFDTTSLVKFQSIMVHDAEGNRCYLSANGDGLVTQCFPAD